MSGTWRIREIILLRAASTPQAIAADPGRRVYLPAFGSAEETNERYKYLIERGNMGLSVAFDLPTLMGYDSDAPEALGEFGKCGVAVSCLKRYGDSRFRHSAGQDLDQPDHKQPGSDHLGLLYCGRAEARHRDGSAARHLAE